MSVDLRTEMNGADSLTGWTGQGKEALNTTTGQFYEPTGSIEDQRSNADEETYGTMTSADLTDATCYILSKDNLVDSFANGGIQYVIGDGTDLIGYDVGGFDARGLQLRYYYSAHKLDVSVVVATPGNFATYAGSEANLNQAAITQCGIGTLHLAKAVGSIANCWVDRMAFHTNTAYGLRINGGTVGTPETMADVQGDDETNGWGMINNPLGAQYGFFAPTEWGEPAANADAYFTASGEQWFLIGDNAGGHAIGTGNFYFRVVGNATDTISFVLDTVVIVNTGTRASFDLSDGNVDIQRLDNVTFTGLGAITGPDSAANKYFRNCIFNDCAQVDLGDQEVTDCTFNGTPDANGAIIIDVASPDKTRNWSGLVFNSDGSGHAVYITAAGTYDLDGWFYNGYSASPEANAAIYNNSGGLVTLNIVGGGDTPSVRNGAGASTVINNNVNVTITNLQPNTEVRVYPVESPIQTTAIAGIENTGSPGEFTFSAAAGLVVDIVVFNVDYVLPPDNRIRNFIVPNTDSSFPISQIADRNYSNP